MASYVIAAGYTTISITTGGDDVTGRGNWIRIKNLGANAVSFSDASSPTGAVTAGSQSSINPVPATGAADTSLIPPYTKMFFKAATGATLVGFEEVYALPLHT
jgi:hypothetical protein